MSPAEGLGILQTYLGFLLGLIEELVSLIQRFLGRFTNLGLGLGQLLCLPLQHLLSPGQ
jgi:hypothetical protein